MNGTQPAAVPGWISWCLRVAIVVVVAACIAAWLAVDRDHRAGHDQGSATGAAAAVATSAADLGAQLQAALDALAVSEGSTGEAIAHTVGISQNLRVLVSVVAGSSGLDPSAADQLDAIANSLGDLEASLLETEGGVGESQQAFVDAQPLVKAAVDALRSASDDVHGATGGNGSGERLWWRVAIVLTGFVLVSIIGALLGIERRLRATAQP